AENRVHIGVVGDVVAEIGHRRREDGRDPDRVDPQPLEVVELRREPRQIPDAIAVAVGEGARIDLVDDPALPPKMLSHRVLLSPGRPAHAPALVRSAAVPSAAALSAATLSAAMLSAAVLSAAALSAAVLPAA